MLGDRNDEKQRQRLVDASPVSLASHVKAPLFIMHGEDDTTVPIGQAYEMVAALKKAGHSPETLYLDRVGHWWPVNKRGVVFLERLEAFLAANLGK